MKKFFILLLVMISFFVCLPITRTPEKIGLIPLDSRPCNTQYPKILGTMANARIEIPYMYLDNYLDPANTEKLWDWLNTEAKNFDKVIINTTVLFNGSLIKSRHHDSYQNIQDSLNKLEEFCRINKKKEIIVITVLPRLLPSQFSDLWKYKDQLTTYAKEIDQAAIKGDFLPKPPKAIPQNIINKYLSTYDNAQLMIKKITSLTQQGLVDHFLIGQDDAEKFGLSNKIIRELKPSFNENIHFVHGADELTMLALARMSYSKPKEGLKIVFANDELKNAFFPFEAAGLEDILKTKMNYLNLSEDSQASSVEVIYNDYKTLNVLEKTISETKFNYLGVMDIAYTNKGDVNLIEKSSLQKILKKIDGYAGWNTTSNTIGTELAHFVFNQNLKRNFKHYNKASQKQALVAYIKFKFIRIAEDLIYQGILRAHLNKELLEKNLNPYNLGENKSTAEKILKELYKPYQEKLEACLVGEYRIGDIKFTVEKISSEINLPWARTFEAKIIPQVTLTIQ